MGLGNRCRLRGGAALGAAAADPALAAAEGADHLLGDVRQAEDDQEDGDQVLNHVS